MRKSLFTLLFASVLAFTAGTAQAQSNITIGPKLGVAYTWIGYDGADAPDDQNGRIGLVGGGFFTYSTDRLLGFSAELLYSGKGSTWKAGDVEVKQRLHYVDIPLMLKFFLVREGNIRPNLFIGPSLNFLVKAEGGVNDDFQFDEKEDFTDDCNTFELGGVVGAGLNIQTLENQWLNFDVRYNMGFTNFNKDQEGVDLDGRNNGVVLSVGYGFGF